MPWPSHRTTQSWWLLVVLIGLVGLLGGLQHHWLGEVSRAERTRMRSWLDAGSHRFAVDFDREVARLVVTFAFARSGREETVTELSAAYASWQETAPWPALLGDVVVGEIAPDGKLELFRLEPSSQPTTDPMQHELVAFAWPEGIAALTRSDLGRSGPQSGQAGSGPGEIRRGQSERSAAAGPVDPLDLSLAAIDTVRLPSFLARRRRGPPGDDVVPVPPTVLLRIDRHTAATLVLPELGKRHLVGDDGPYPFVVLAADGQEIYRSGSPPAQGAPDVTMPLFGQLPLDEWRGLLPSDAWPPPPELRQRLHDQHWPHQRPPQRSPPGTVLPGGQMWARVAQPSEHLGVTWQLAVWHPQGSLEVAVDRLHRRHLAIGFGILVLLTGSGSFLLVTARRAQALAHQQLQLVSAITHELRTPLAGVRSLGENLADGIVTRPDQVRRYGELIEREGSRLSQLVEQALALSGLLAHGRKVQRVGLDLAELIELAVDDCRALREESGAPPPRLELGPERRSEVATAPSAPAAVSPPAPFFGDPSALRRALANLLQNAYRHGGGEVVVRLTTTSREVQIEVADQGPGIPAVERARLFEPFVRGERAVQAQIPGSGLGLHLVKEIAEAHGGRVEVVSVEGQGSRFRLVLPVIAPPAESAQ